MVSIQEKLNVLSKLASEFNKYEIVWAVGASLLLYFKGYVEDFNDIDLMVTEKDAIKMENILNRFGTIQLSTKGNYETKHFREFIINDVDVDMIGGFAIVCDGQVFDCDLKQSQVVEYIEINGQKIPLHSIDLWRKYYALMGRNKKVAIIDKRK